MMTRTQRNILNKMEENKQYGLNEARRLFHCELHDLTELYHAGYIDIPEYHGVGRNWHFVKTNTPLGKPPAS